MLDDVREWISDNLIYILIGSGALALIIVVALIIGAIKGSGKSGSEEVKENVQVEQATEATVQEAFVSDLTDDDAAILTLVKQFYTAVKNSDTSTLSSIMDPWDSNVEKETLENKVIEDYYNIHTHSKPGLNEGEYVVYTYYEAKMANIETMAPTLVAQYVKTAADGELKIFPLNTDDTVKAYVTEVATQPDVQDLIANVKTKYENALNSDANLKAYIDTLDTTGEAAQNEDVEIGGQMVTTPDMMNIRSEPSTSGAVLSMVASGTAVTVLETADGGWVKISADVQGTTVTGYVMSEYLAPAATDNAA